MSVGKSTLLKKKRTKKIVLCSSASFYKEVLEIERKLKKLGFKVTVPCTAHTMRKNNNFDVSFYKTWFKDPATYKRKAYFIRHHFRKIIASDAILVVNLKKNGSEGYIGGNLLMEMAIAFHYRKPIFVLNEVLKDSPFYEEILGMAPVFIEANLSKIPCGAS
ncbi:MAG: hypothetical protein Q8P89_04445 [bacterium]|nr:hypothetical protein [bacterium]